MEEAELNKNRDDERKNPTKQVITGTIWELLYWLLSSIRLRFDFVRLQLPEALTLRHAPYLTETEPRSQVVELIRSSEPTGGLLGTEWRVLARSLHAGVTP